MNALSAFMKYVSFNVLGMIGLSCYILADTFFVANGVGANGLTALNLAIPVYNFINGVGLMIAIGASTRFAISKSKEVFTSGLYFIVICGTIFVLTGLIFSNGIASLLGADSITIADTNIYLKIILLFSPMFMLNSYLQAFIRNDKNPSLAMVAMIMGSVANIILDYIFIMVFGMGMFGAVLATGVSPIVGLLVMSTHFIRKNNTFKFMPKLKLTFKRIKDIAVLGVSSFVTEMASGIVIIVFNILILNLSGNTGVAAYGVITNVALVVMSVFTGIAQGTQPLISDAYGKGENKIVKKLLKYALITSVIVAIISYASGYIFSENIVSLFNKDNDATLLSIAVQGIRIYFISFLFSGINVITTLYFTSMDKPQYAMIISILRGFVLIIPVAIILSIMYNMNGVWSSVVVTEIIVMLVGIIINKKNNKQVKYENTI